MTEAEHLQVAQRLIVLAERHRREGDDVAMAEMLWGAANRVTKAISLQHELGSGHRLPRFGSVIHHIINDHQIELNLQQGVEAIGALHGHFYNSHLEPDALTRHVADAQTLIDNLLDIYDRHGSN